MRRRAIAILFGWFLLWPSLVRADAAADEARRTLGFGMGLRGDAVREDLLVPLAFAGPGVQLQGFYRGWVGPGVLVARADLGFAFLFNRYGHQAGTLTYSADAAWTLTVLRANTWHVALGPALALDSRISLLFSWDDAHAYWLGSQWLGPAARFMSRLNDVWRLEASAAMAFLGFEGRPPSYRYHKQETSPDMGYFFTRPQRSEKLVLLDELQVLRLDVAVRRAAYQRFDVGRGWAFGVDFRLARTSIPATNINLSACLYASRAWGL